MRQRKQSHEQHPSMVPASRILPPGSCRGLPLSTVTLSFLVVLVNVLSQQQEATWDGQLTRGWHR